VKTAFACLFAALVAAGCSTRSSAPVVDRTPGSKPAPGKPVTGTTPAPATKPADGRADTYLVKKGDTLYSIALDHGLDYRELAQWNGITDPGVISVGLALRLKPPASAATAAPFKAAPGVEGRPLGDAQAGAENVKTQPKAVREPYSEQAHSRIAGAKPAGREEGEDGITWSWPATGKVVSTFNDGANLKGIGIAGKLGQPVIASAPGRVIFSGTGIRGFGKLVVIKHNNTFLSVYAHNNQLLVKEGQNVTKGQRIAEMGSTDADQVKLHFEIRRFGKPVDPIKLLPPA
jgi:lipoprotein NlpD